MQLFASVYVTNVFKIGRFYLSINDTKRKMMSDNCLAVTEHKVVILPSRFCVYGGLFHAPLVFNWLRLAARLFPKDTNSHLLAKVFLDQTCFAPVGLSAFYIGLTAMEGKDLEGIYKEWREKFPNTWAVSCKFSKIFHERCRSRKVKEICRHMDKLCIWLIEKQTNGQECF